MPVAIPFSAVMMAPRHILAVLLARIAHGWFYLMVAALVLGVPLGLGYVLWRWLMGGS